MSNQKMVIPFQKSEQDAKQEWLELLLNNENVPIDVAYKTTYEVVREYYPFALYNMDCVASWSAKSIWEHEEQYQEEKTETVYIDYQGKEHKFGGSDFEIKHRGDSDGKGNWYRSPTSVSHKRTPHTRTVYKTKTRTIIDDIQPTSSNVGPLNLTNMVATSGLPDLGWAKHFDKSKYKEVDDAFFEDYVLMPETISEDSAQSQAKTMAEEQTAQFAQNDVPGDRFEDFILDSFKAITCERIDAFLPVFHITYEYEGEKFECYISGGTEDEDYKFEGMPVDENIKVHTELLDEHIEKNGFISRKTLFLIGGVFLLFATIAMSMGTGWLFSPTSSTLAWVVLVGGVWCITRFAIMQLSSNKLNEEKQSFSSENTTLKTQVLEISSDDALSDVDKQQKIETLLSSHSEGTSSRFDSMSKMVEKQKKLTRLVNIIGLAALIAAIVITVSANAITENNKMNEILSSNQQTEEPLSKSSEPFEVTTPSSQDQNSKQDTNNSQSYQFENEYTNEPSYEEMFILPDVTYAYYTESDLAPLNDFELYLARNEIYARHGRIFKNQDLKNYFESCSWYEGIYSPETFDSVVTLNQYEKKNANTILELEKKRNSPYVN